VIDPHSSALENVQRSLVDRVHFGMTQKSNWLN
jgi:hypothetical protein